MIDFFGSDVQISCNIDKILPPPPPELCSDHEDEGYRYRFLCLLLLFFEKGFKILATEYSEFLDSDNSDGGDNPTEADYDYI